MIPWLTLSDVWRLRDGTCTIIEETEELISELGIANSAAEVHPAGTVVLSRTASVGFSCILGRDMATSQDFATWTCGSQLLPRFLLYALRGQPEEIERRKTGSTHKTIYMPDIETLRVPLPPLSEQAAVVAFLDAETANIDRLIRQRSRMLGLLREREEAVIDDLIWSVSGRRTPLMWLTPDERPITYGIVLPGPNVERGVLLVKGGDVEAGRLSPDQLCRTAEEIEAPYARARLQRGDVVFSIRGSVGAAATVPPDIEGANITQDVARISPQKGVNPEWLLHAVRSKRFRMQVEARVTGATIRGVNIWDLKRCCLPVPPGSLQAQMAAAAAQLSEHTARHQGLLNRQIDLLRERRRALITAAVTGQLDISTAA